MDSAFLSWLGSLAIGEIVILTVIWSILYIIYIKLTDNSYYSKIHDVKTTNKARLWSFISGELELIEAHSMNKAEEIIGRSRVRKCEACDSDPKLQQLTMFGMVLERVLHSTTFEEIKTYIRINGFYKKTGADLDAYIADKADVLLRKVRKIINQKGYYYPLLRGTDEQRFTLDDSIKFFTKIIHKAIEINKEQEIEIKKLKDQYSIVNKLNIFKMILSKFMKENNNDS